MGSQPSVPLEAGLHRADAHANLAACLYMPHVVGMHTSAVGDSAEGASMAEWKHVACLTGNGCGRKAEGARAVSEDQDRLRGAEGPADAERL